MPHADAGDPGPEDCRIVGIGASAGGIRALQSVFEALPRDPNLAFVVVQHLPPAQPSLLATLIAKWALLPVHAASDGVQPQPNHIYIPAPDQLLTLEEGVFRTRPLDGNGRPGIDTIDTFLESLATDQRARAIAVVLSGTGMDGASGAACIRQAGGIVLVQDPLTALHEGMPNAVIARGIADHVLPIGAMAEQLVACAAPLYERPASASNGTSGVSQTLDRILQFIRQQAGFDLSGYKPSPLLWRIQQRMSLRRVRTFEDYLDLLQDDSAELEALVRGIPIHTTMFFRDPDAWEIMSRSVVDPLFAEVGDERAIRTWTPACSTGEEAYSLAMLLHERAGHAGAKPTFQVFGTDASSEILARASHGSFPERSLAVLSAARKAQFFYAADGAYRVKRSLREMMVFAPQDLVSDPPFTSLDIVTCRNLLIYLDHEAVQRVLFMLHSSLRMGGYLFLGKGEPLSPRQKGFAPISTHWNMYRKTGPISNVRVKFATLSSHHRRASAVPAIAHRAAVEQFALPSVLIDDQFHVLRVYGDTDRVLRLPEGAPTHSLLDLAPPSLAADIQLAAHDALIEQRALTVQGAPDPETGELAMSLRFTPLQTPEEGGPARLLVSFIRNDARAHATSRKHHASPANSREWSEAVRISHAELEASREELQALNEELKASNEQLNMSNEDLNRANAQLQEKLAELEMQSQVLFSGGVITIFLDEELRVRWFTPAVAELFPLRNGDIGRTITDLTQKFEDRNFVNDVFAVMKSHEQRGSEVRTGAGKWFLRRVHPYIDDGDTVAGVAVTFTDITERKRHEAALGEREERQAFLLAFSDALRAERDEASVAMLAVRLLAEQLKVDRCLIAEMHVSEDRALIPYQFVSAGMATVPSLLRMSDFPKALQLILASTCAFDDIANDASLSDPEKRLLTELEVGAHATAILRRGERNPIWAMVAMSSQPRPWTPGEVALLEEVTERTWLAVQRAHAETAVRESEMWLAGQKEAFQRALYGASLEASLDALVSTALERFGPDTRCAFYIADANGGGLHLITGMTPDYGRCIDGFEIGPESLACGLAVHTRQPVITPDVTEDPKWKDWLWLANDFEYRGCWSFPITTASGKAVGTLAFYHRLPRAATARDVELANMLTGAAGVIIARYQDMRPSLEARS